MKRCATSLPGAHGRGAGPAAGAGTDESVSPAPRLPVFGKSSWTEAHRLYLRELVFSHRAHRLVLEDALRVIAESEARIKRLEKGTEMLLEQWDMKPVVQALMGMRGF